MWGKELQRAEEGKGPHSKRKEGVEGVRCGILTNAGTRAGIRVHFPLLRTDNECM